MVAPIEGKEKVMDLEKAEDVEQAGTKSDNNKISSDVKSDVVAGEKENDSTAEKLGGNRP